MLVAHSLLKKPGHYADAISFMPQPDPRFRKAKDLKDLLPLLFIEKSTNELSDEGEEDKAKLLSMLESDDSDGTEAKKLKKKKWTQKRKLNTSEDNSCP